MRTTTRLVGLMIGLSLTHAGCGSDDEGGTADHATGMHTAASGEVFNDADVEFATSMIPHHAQAVQMVVMAQGRPLDPEVQQLANDVRDVQVPEVEIMTDWLTAWGEEVPETSLDHANAGHDMDDVAPVEGMDDMPGMMTAEEMEALADASDADFQDLWLEMMTRHHEGAIEMAKTEQADGHFEPALELAAEIEQAQKAEIEVMSGLLA